MARPLSYRLLPLALTLAAAAPASAAEGCQEKLEKAVAAITESGSFKAVTTRLLNDKPISEQIIEFAPPTDARFKERTRLEGKDLEAMQARLKDLPPEMQGTESPWITYVGQDMYIGPEKQPYGDPERAASPAGQLFGLSPFADPTVYFATDCKADGTIGFEWDPYAITVMTRAAEEADISFDIINAERRKLRAEDDAAFNESSKVAFGTLELDAQGRPARIRRDDPMPESQFTELAKLLFPGVTIPAGSSLSLDIAITYDPAIRIAAP